MDWETKMKELSAQLKMLTDSKGGFAAIEFCVKKIFAAAEKDEVLYIQLLEEELAAAAGGLARNVREGELTREIVERLRSQIDILQEQQEEVLAMLRDTRERCWRLLADKARLEEDLAAAEGRLEAATGMLGEAGLAEEAGAAERRRLEEDLAAAGRLATRLRSERDYWRGRAGTREI
jgi:hypothetical protein